MGISSSIGYEIKINDKLSTNMDFQISKANGNTKNLLGNGIFIPGMGYNGFQNNLFPMILLNIKYGL